MKIYQRNVKIEEKGITLVALVVTIVVLLILVAITINLLFNNNGIIKRAQDAKNTWENEESKEQEGLKELENITNYYINGISGENDTEDSTKDWDLNKVTKEVIDGQNIPVPQGYTLSKATGETSIATGLVLYEGKEEVNDENVTTAQTTRNQFVWIPVKNATTMYEIQDGKKVGKLYDFSVTGYTAKTYPGKNVGYREPDIITQNNTGDSTEFDGDFEYYNTILGLNSSGEFLSQLQNEFDKMIESVEKYKGFYVGRYETGNLKSDTTTIPVVKKRQTTINNVVWYYHYQNSKKVAGNNEVVRSSMIWGCQWDRILQWLVESGNKTYAEITDSTNWGNYTATIKPTGSIERCKANNIYDLARKCV